MVVISSPPPGHAIAPIHQELPAGSLLVRIFDPTRYGAQPLSFRHHGPLMRFDHHVGIPPDGSPHDDPERGVYYAAWSGADTVQALASCLVETFGDTLLVEMGEKHVAVPTLTRDVRLLDLRGSGAMRAGTVAAIAKCEHRHSQPWSRYFYETTAAYGAVDGVSYLNAHNDGLAVLLYERSEDALSCPPIAVTRLDDPSLRPLLLSMMLDNNLSFP